MEIPKWVDVERLRREAKFEPTGRWITSRLSELALVGSRKGPDHVTLKDETLRSGANTPGVIASNSMKLRIARKLREAGIIEVEGGYPGIDKHCEFMKLLEREGLGLRVGAHARMHIDDYQSEADRALEAGAEIINWLGRGSYLMTIAAVTSLDGQRSIDRIHEAVTYARSQGAFVSIGMPSEDIETLHDWVVAARDAGAHRVYIYDGRGWYTPDVVRFLVHYVKDLVGGRCEVGLHCHDDFGLATINAVEGARAGADIVDVTVNGTGHRCGNACFEQVVVALEVLHGISTGIDLRLVCSLSKLVEEVYGIPVPANAPVVGKNMYSHGGNHLVGALKAGWISWENIRAETVGAQRRLVYGPTALQRGPSAPIPLKVKTMGLEATEEQLARIVARLRERIAQQAEVSDPEVEGIVREVLA